MSCMQMRGQRRSPESFGRGDRRLRRVRVRARTAARCEMRRQISSTVEEGVRNPPNDEVRSYWRSLVRRCDETTPTSLEHPRTAAQSVDASHVRLAREPISNVSAIRCVSTGHMQHAPTYQHVPVTWVPGPALRSSISQLCALSRPNQYPQLRLTNTNPTRPQWKCNAGHVSVREKNKIVPQLAFVARDMCAHRNGRSLHETRRRFADAALSLSTWLVQLSAQEVRACACRERDASGSDHAIVAM